MAEFAPSWQKFVAEFGEAPALEPPLQNMLDSWMGTMHRFVAFYGMPATDTSVQTEDFTLKNCWVRVYTPPNSTDDDPIGVYFHGGGWAMGAVDEEDGEVRFLSKACRMKMVSVSYRLAPEFPCPIPLDDCVEGVLWTLEHFNVKNVTLVGASAGGQLALGSALKLVDQGLADRVKGVMALVPVTVHPDAVPDNLRSKYTSYDENANNTVNSRDVMMEFWKVYGASPSDPYTSTLLHPKLGSLKKIYIAECGMDTLRDDARLMKEALEKENVNFRYHAYSGFPHYSWTFPSKELDEHRDDFHRDVVDGIRWINGI